MVGDAHVGAFLIKPQTLKDKSGALAGLELLVGNDDSTNDSEDALFDVGTFANVSSSYALAWIGVLVLNVGHRSHEHSKMLFFCKFT